MLRWILYLPLSILTSVLCYLTNPIAVLFCDKNGELPGVFGLWQTWDNSCNPSDVTNKHELPAFLCYDWKKHYEEWRGSTPKLYAQGRERWFTTCIDSHWTIKERIQRYICRVYWLTRNCAYGWAFWPLGILPGVNWKYEQNDGETLFVHEDVPYWWLLNAWCYKSTAPLFTIWGYTVRREIFIGWKVKPEARVDTRGMIATRITVRIKKEGD